MEPPPENYNATIHLASTTPKLMTVLPSDPILHPNPPEIFLVRQQEPTQAYALTGKHPLTIGTHRDLDWGCVFFAVVCPVIGLTGNVFQAPDPGTEKFVAIKRLNKRIVDRYLALGGEENPYKEMARMEELGDNVHVLRHEEFLEDDEYLYLVTPKACQDGTLKDAIPWCGEDIMVPSRSHLIFCKILKILGYLERHGINHHDLSPDNFLFLTPDNLVVFDLALSVRIPINPATGQRSLIAPQGNFGTYAWMDPIVFLNQQAYDGGAMDLWAAGIILYNILTNQSLYRIPHPVDAFGYRYSIQAQGLSRTPLNVRSIPLLNAIGYLAQFDEYCRVGLQRMIAKATAHLNLTPQAIELLEKLLKENPAERCTLTQAMTSTYV